MKCSGHFLEQEGGLGIYHAGARMYDPEVPRFYGVDAMRGKYPWLSSYVYAANNPLIFIDPDGREVRCYTEDQCDRLVSDIQELYGDAPIAYEQHTETSRGWFGLGPEKTTTYYAITIDGESDFNWAQDDYALALYDAIASEDVIFDVQYSTQLPTGQRYADGSFQRRDGQGFGGGRFLRTNSSRAGIYIDPRGDQRTGIPSSIILMHEMIGHGHPVAKPTSSNPNNAHDINNFYQEKLGIQQRVPYRNSHPGYQYEIIWPRINLYQNR